MVTFPSRRQIHVHGIWLVAWLMLLAFSRGPMPVAAQNPSPSDRTIVVGQVGLSFYAVVGGVVQELLEREGYAVEVIQGGHAQIFPRLGSGEVDILAAAWLPHGHAALYASVEDATFPVAALYQDARFFWVVPAYVPDTLLASLADLARPAVRQRVSPRIVSLPSETGLTISAHRAWEAYNLGAAGYEIVPSTPDEWLSAFREAVAAGDWIIFPLWQPHWVNATYDVRRLRDPKDALGAPDTAYLLGHTSLRAKLSPSVLALLSNMRLSIEAVTAMDRMVNVDGLPPRAAARRWMNENTAVVRAWATGN